MEASKAEEVIAICRKGLAQPGNEIYCLTCADKFKARFNIEGTGKSTGCGGEYQWMIKSDLEAMRASCTSCGEPITIEPRLKAANA